MPAVSRQRQHSFYLARRHGNTLHCAAAVPPCLGTGERWHYWTTAWRKQKWQQKKIFKGNIGRKERGKGTCYLLPLLKNSVTYYQAEPRCRVEI